jgi:hypothetical protein
MREYRPERHLLRTIKPTNRRTGLTFGGADPHPTTRATEIHCLRRIVALVKIGFQSNFKRYMKICFMVRNHPRVHSFSAPTKNDNHGVHGVTQQNL